MDNSNCDLKDKCDRLITDMQLSTNHSNSDSKNSCKHINIFKAEEGLKIYNIVHSHFIACTTDLYRKRKVVNTRCHQCRSRKRLHSCLHCVFFGCYDGHVQAHYARHDHYLYVDLIYGNILCMKCADYDYDDELADIARRNLLDASKDLGHPAPSWIPLWLTKKEILEVQRHSKRLRLNSSPIGLRPLVNMGNTCYMNCIIQVLMRTPLLRNYLMSGQHKCSNSDGMCVMCEYAELFEEFYCGGKEGLLAPSKLLYLMWMHKPELAGYKQQDAQEFFLATLDILHKNCVQSENEFDLKKDLDLRGEVNFSKFQSIIKQTFMGKYQSDVVCQNCKGVSSTVESFSDISLDLGPTPDGSSLLDCLKRFTSPELLEVKFKCNSCNSIQLVTKQYTLKKIPIVASFQLKRFENVINKTLVSKVSNAMSFPEVLDMTPYMTKSRNGTPSQLFSPYDNRYILFGVINHYGQSDIGHYTAFVRLPPNFWYKCNDNKITKATLKEVLDSEGYLLFYHKRTVEYF